MKILLELDVDDTLAREYEHLAPENKLQFKQAVYQMLEKTTTNLRSKKLKMLLEEIRNGSESRFADFDPEIIYAILCKQE